MNKKVSFGARPAVAATPPDPEEWIKNRGGQDAAAVPAPEPEEPKEPTKRLTFDIPKSLHARIKAMCAAEDKFMNEEIIKLLEQRWPKPEA